MADSENHIDKGKKPSNHFTGIGTYVPTPSPNQPRNHGHAPGELAHPNVPEHSDKTSYDHKVGK